MAKSFLYIIPRAHLQHVSSAIADESIDSSAIANHDAQTLIAKIRLGGRIVAMTTLNNGDVLFAVEG